MTRFYGTISPDWYQFRIDYAFSLVRIKTGVDATLRRERPFTIPRPGRTSLVRELGRNGEELGPALGLFGLTVEGGVAYVDGCLELRFRDGTVLLVHPDVEGDEAWELVIDSGFHLVSLSGGGLAVWRERDSAE